MKDECCNKDDCDEMSSGGCGGDTGEGPEDCPNCCTRCFLENMVKGNPEAAEFKIRTTGFDIGLDPPTCCASLDGETALTYDADSDTWIGGSFILSLACSNECEGDGGTIAVDCEDAASEWSWDGSNWIGDGAGTNGLGCLQAGQNEGGDWICHFGATIYGDVDMHGGTVATLYSDVSEGTLTLNSDGSFTYDADADPSAIVADGFSYTVDADPTVYNVTIKVYPSPKVNVVWQSDGAFPPPNCCENQFPPPFGPPGPYQPVPFEDCCTNLPGAFLYVPSRCNGSMASGECFFGPCGTGGFGTCPPILLTFDHLSGSSAVYSGTIPNTCSCGDASDPTEVSVTVGCSVDGPHFTAGFMTGGTITGEFGCNLSGIVTINGNVLYGGGSCSPGDWGCIGCVMDATGAPLSPCADIIITEICGSGANYGFGPFKVYAL